MRRYTAIDRTGDILFQLEQLQKQLSDTIRHLNKYLSIRVDSIDNDLNLSDEVTKHIFNEMGERVDDFVSDILPNLENLENQLLNRYTDKLIYKRYRINEV